MKPAILVLFLVCSAPSLTQCFAARDIKDGAAVVDDKSYKEAKPEWAGGWGWSWPPGSGWTWTWPPQPSQPSLPPPKIPVPQIPIPQIPNIPIPQIPKITIPPIPQIPKITIPPIPQIPKNPVPPTPQIPDPQIPQLPDMSKCATDWLEITGCLPEITLFAISPHIDSVCCNIIKGIDKDCFDSIFSQLNLSGFGPAIKQYCSTHHH